MRISGAPVVEVLPNGLTLLVQDHRAADIVAVHLWVATGVRYKSPETLGHAHFQEHMLFKGTDTFGPGHIDRTVEETGGRSNAFTAFDYTTYQVSCLARRRAPPSDCWTTWPFVRRSTPRRWRPSARSSSRKAQ